MAGRRRVKWESSAAVLNVRDILEQKVRASGVGGDSYVVWIECFVSGPIANKVNIRVKYELEYLIKRL